MEKTVEIIEALAGRPAIEGAIRPGFPLGNQMPLAEGGRGVAVQS